MDMPELINSPKPAAQLSRLQKAILKAGLRAYWWTAPVRRAWAGGSLAAAAFNNKPVLIDFYLLSKEELRRPARWQKQPRQPPPDKLVRARVAIHQSAKSLKQRGLLAPTRARGWWQLTTLGRKVASRFCPELTRPARRELLPKIKEAYLERINRGYLTPGTDFKSFVGDCFRPGVKTPLD